jgi:predicted alpha-1,2-mannosidase
MQFDYPPDAGDEAAIVVQTGQTSPTAANLGEIQVVQRGSVIRLRGKAMASSGGTPDNFACYFVMEIEGGDYIDHALLHTHGFVHGQDALLAPRAGVCLTLHPRGPVVVRVATSFISHDQAHLNLHRELAGRGLVEVSEEAGRLWDRWLGRVQADGGSESDRRTLYSCLYRVGLWPMSMHELDSSGQWRHYSPHTGGVHPGLLVTNNGFWDTYRTVYPLLRLIDPVGFGQIMEGWLAHHREGGWMSRWASPGYRECMIGTHSDAIVSEAILGGIGGFDHDEAYEAVRRHAFEPAEGHRRYGRQALREYLDLGYVPYESVESALSWTLDNAHCDWCLGRIAQKLGRHDDARSLLARGQNYRHVWDPGTQFFRPRLRDGQWVEPFGEFQWGYGYVEGGPWQYRFQVPHDPQGLAELMGGTDALLAKLEAMLSAPPRFNVGRYGREVHEMTSLSMAVDASGRSFGQYAHSNQPVHAFLLLPAVLGRPEWTARQVERVMRGLYSPDTFPGDEDNGEMAAWYVLGALGRVSPCPGSGVSVDVPVRVFDRCVAKPAD